MAQEDCCSAAAAGWSVPEAHPSVLWLVQFQLLLLHIYFQFLLD